MNNKLKKLLLVVILFLAAFVTNAEPLYYKATALSIKMPTSGPWSPWQSTDVQVTMDFDTHHIEIFSKEIQIFDYLSWESATFNGGTLLGSYATDVNYGKVYIQLILFDAGDVYFTVAYDDVEYRYFIEL